MTVPTTSASSVDSANVLGACSTARPTFGMAGAAGVVLLIFISVAPTLTWLEFSNGSENLVVQTVLEIRRSGVWLVPTLQGEPRVQKPPLAAWISAAAVSDRTVES